LVFELAVFVRGIVEFGLRGMNHAFLPLQDIQGQVAPVPLLAALQKVEEQVDLGIIGLNIKLLDQVDHTDTVVDGLSLAKRYAFFVFAKEDVQLALLQTDVQLLED
jgi:hypothetical protein